MREIAQPTTSALPRQWPIAKTLAMPLGLALATTTAVVPALLGAPSGTRRIALPMFVAGAAVTFGVGFYELVRGRDRNLRFARVLIAAGLLWSLSALAASPEPTLYSLGRVSQWFVELATVYLLLSYPSGQLTEPGHRMLFASAGLVVAVLYLPTALIAQRYPTPSPWSMCTVGCPHNAFALGNSTPALVPDLVAPVRELLTAALLAVVAGVAIQRSRNGGALLGRMSAPIALIAVAQVVILAVYFRVRAIAPAAAGLSVLSWIYVLSLPSVALAAAAGRLYRRLFAVRALDRMAGELRTSATPVHVGRAMSDALKDPSLKILHSFPGDAGLWVDESGSPIAMPQSGDEHAVTVVANGNWRIAIVHDPMLAEDPAVVQTAGSYALAALENNQLSGELRSSLEELAEARVLRIDAERRGRRKIERDIHDGAQQRLIALRLKLALAAERIGTQDATGADALRELAEDVDATIEEVRSFAHGIYPPLLAETGLAGALKAFGRGMALPTSIEAEKLGRYSRAIETTVYFSCSEALQNAVKHARGATHLTIRVWDDGELNFEVRDDGHGFDLASTPFGTGLSSLSDRLAAVGGRIRIQSAPGHGTTVGGTIPRS